MIFIKHKFGSYRGYLQHLRARVAAGLGRYDAVAKIDLARVERLVFVCKGNVCRSPYAQVKAGAMGVAAISFGLDTTGDVPANSAAQRAAQLRQVDLSSHRATLFDSRVLQDTDLVLAFEPSHLQQLQQLAGTSGAQFSLLGMWVTSGLRPIIADPFGKSDEYFQACFSVIDRSLERLCTARQSARLPAIGSKIVATRRQA